VGLTASEFADLPERLLQHGISVSFEDQQDFSVVRLNPGTIALHLIPARNHFTPEALLALQATYQKKNTMLIQLWADVWISRKQQVLDRLRSLSGINKRIHGRKTQIITINQAEADDFLQSNHIQGAVKARYKYALQYDDDIVAVATFSNTRLMTQHQQEYRSAELIRFASKAGLTVTGGLTKLIRYYCSKHEVHDIMTYADRDWSDGKGYLATGFVLTQAIEPTSLWIDPVHLKRYFNHRLPEGEQGSEGTFIAAFNTGNMKFILYL